MKVLAVLSCLWALQLAVQAQAPNPCVCPPLMSGSFSVMGGNGLFTSMGSISYENFGQKAKVKNVGFVNSTSFSIDLLMLFSQKVYYEVDWKRYSCKKRALDAAFIPMQVPADAKLMGQAFLGSSSSWGMGVLVNTWNGNLPNGLYSVVFSEVGCIPITYTAHSPASGWTTVSTYNWVIGNIDPMDFVPPFFCAEARVDETEAPRNFFTILEDFAQVKSEESLSEE